MEDVSDGGGADPAPKLVDAVVKALLEDNELQIGLVNACIEVRAWQAGGGRQGCSVGVGR